MPVALEGVFEIWPRNRPLEWRRLLPGAGTRVKVVFGAPVQPDTASTAASQDDAYVALTRLLRDAVETMWMAAHTSRSS